MIYFFLIVKVQFYFIYIFSLPMMNVMKIIWSLINHSELIKNPKMCNIYFVLFQLFVLLILYHLTNLLLFVFIILHTWNENQYWHYPRISIIVICSFCVWSLYSMNIIDVYIHAWNNCSDVHIKYQSIDIFILHCFFCIFLFYT